MGPPVFQQVVSPKVCHSMGVLQEGVSPGNAKTAVPKGVSQMEDARGEVNGGGSPNLGHPRGFREGDFMWGAPRRIHMWGPQGPKVVQNGGSSKGPPKESPV